MTIKQQLLSMNRRSVVIAFAFTMLVVTMQHVLNIGVLLRQDLGSRATMLGFTCVGDLKIGNVKGLKNSLEALRQTSNVIQAAIYGKEGTLLSAFSLADETVPPRLTPGMLHFGLEGGSLVLIESIRSEDEAIGTILLKYDTTPLLTRVKIDVMLLATIAVLGIFVASILFSRFQRSISDPMLKLVEAMHEVSRNQDYSFRVSSNGLEELNNLASEFNQMLATLQKWKNEIFEHRQNLERLVEERTNQWKDANQHLELELEERRQREGELHHKTEELAKVSEDRERALKAEKRFLATMSHDMRTPLNAVVGFIEVLLTTRIDDQQKRLLDSIKTSSQHLLALICDVLDVSKIDSGQMELSLSPLDLVALFEECTTIIGSSMEQGVTLRNEIPLLPYAVLGDSLRLKQIFLNILGNAAKFTSQGHVRLFLIQDTPLCGDRTLLEFGIEDTGTGIPADRVQDLFQPFRQINRGKVPGTGLGLYISKALIQLMQGEIRVHSEWGKGTTVYLTLSFEKKPALRKAVKGTRPEPHPRNLNHLRILIAEDFELNIQVVKELLATFFGITDPVIARDGREAVHLAVSSPFDLIFMDVDMPVLDGFQATRDIRKAGIQTPIVALSASVFAEEIHQAREAGMNDYLTKPVKIEQLASILHGLPASSRNAANGMEMSPEPLSERIFKQFRENFQNQQTVERLTRLSLESIKECIRTLEQEWQSRNLPGLERGLHKLHGALLNCGIGDLGGETATYQHQARAGDLESLSRELPGFLKELEACV